MLSWSQRCLPRYITQHLTLGHELVLVVILKIIALVALYYLCFSPPHRPHADTAAHIMGGVDISQPQLPER